LGLKREAGILLPTDLGGGGLKGEDLRGRGSKGIFSDKLGA